MTDFWNSIMFQIMKRLSIAPYDQNLIMLETGRMLDENSATLQQLNVHQDSVIILKVKSTSLLYLSLLYVYILYIYDWRVRGLVLLNVDWWWKSVFLKAVPFLFIIKWYIFFFFCLCKVLVKCLHFLGVSKNSGALTG